MKNCWPPRSSRNQTKIKRSNCMGICSSLSMYPFQTKPSPKHEPKSGRSVALTEKLSKEVSHWSLCTPATSILASSQRDRGHFNWTGFVATVDSIGIIYMQRETKLKESTATFYQLCPCHNGVCCSNITEIKRVCSQNVQLLCCHHLGLDYPK